MNQRGKQMTKTDLCSKRIAFFYESPSRISRNDGPPLYWKTAAVRKYGKENAIHLLPNGDWGNQGLFDWNFWVDWGEDALMPGLAYVPQLAPSPNVYIASDTHLGYEHRLNTARHFDWVFCNQKRARDEFIKDGIPAEKCRWLPHAAEPLAYPKTEVINKYDISFIGNMGAINRVNFLDAMFKEFPNFFYGRRLFNEAALIYNESKIVLNLSILDDINMRVFEVLCSGSFLLTNELPTQGLLFKDGVHLVTYKDTKDAIEKTKYYLAHDEERNKIAQAGFDLVRKLHTYDHRLASVMDIITKNRR